MLRRGGETVQVQPQVFDVLLHLVRNPGRVVTKEELLDQVWGSRFVSESALTTRIKSARQAIGDDGTAQRMIRTIHGRGYELIAPVRAGESTTTPSSPEPAAAEALPGAVQALIGREELLAELTAALKTTRLISLVGTAGVGKTSLAYELARAVAPSQQDGVHAVELVSVTEAAAVVEALSTALDVHASQDTPLEEAVVEGLRPRQVLLLLDNCEHVAEPVAEIVDRILRHAPRVSVVATTREPLAVTGERIWPVEPLAVPDEETPVGLLGQVPAIRLFVERATAADPRFVLDERNAGAVIEICRRLDGIPLAIELAAARTRTIDVAEIAARLDERFRLLKGVRRGADPRHQALQDAIRWSYDLLSDDEQRLFAELSVFAGQFDLAAAEQVCGYDQDVDVVDLVTRLSERSMVTVRRPDEGGTRYELLETMRAYGRSRLGDDESVALFVRHADHHARLARWVGDGLQGPDEAEAVQRADRAFPDLRAALRFAVQVGDAPTALGLVSDLREYALRTMRYEVLSWAETALGCEGADAAELHPAVTGIQAYGAWVRGEFARALALATAVAEEEARRDLVPSGLAERVRANVLYTLGEIGEGHAASRRQLESAEASGLPARIAHACYMRSVGCSSLGQFDEATELARRARAIGEQTANPTNLASGFVALGFASHDDPAAALDAFGESDRIARAAGNRWMSAFARTEVNGLLLSQGHVDDARAGLAEAVDVWHRAGEWSQQWLTLTRCVPALVAVGEAELAAELIGAIEHRATMGTPPVMAVQREQVLEAAAELRERLGEDQFAERHAAGSSRPIVDVVTLTRAALLG